MKKIPDNIYKDILKYIPRPCVDVIIKKEERILLLHRLLNPDRGKWGLLGGMIMRGESPEQAAVRKCYEEIGVNINETALNFLGVFNYFTLQRQDICITFVVNIGTEPEIVLDNQHDRYTWSAIDALPDKLCRNVTATIRRLA